jgi:hypothetical protein
MYINVCIHQADMHTPHNAHIVLLRTRLVVRTPLGLVHVCMLAV